MDALLQRHPRKFAPMGGAFGSGVDNVCPMYPMSLETPMRQHGDPSADGKGGHVGATAAVAEHAGGDAGHMNGHTPGDGVAAAVPLEKEAPTVLDGQTNGGGHHAVQHAGGEN